MNYEVHITGNNTTETKKVLVYHFNSDNFYENKIKARLFFDEKINELCDDSEILIELFFVKNDIDDTSKFFIKNSLGLENNANKQIENSLLNKTTQPVFEQRKLERDMVQTKNSFLDVSYW